MCIKTKAKFADKLNIPQVSIDRSGFMTTRPDSFLPQVDVLKGDEFYRIYMEVPGLSIENIQIYRQNVMTIIKGVKK